MCLCRSPFGWLHHRCSVADIGHQQTLPDLGPGGGPGRCSHRMTQAHSRHHWPQSLEGTRSPPHMGAQSSWSVQLLSCRRLGRQGCKHRSGCWLGRTGLWKDRSCVGQGWGSLRHCCFLRAPHPSVNGTLDAQGPMFSPTPSLHNQSVGKSHDFHCLSPPRIFSHSPRTTTASCLMPWSPVPNLLLTAARGTGNAGSDHVPHPQPPMAPSEVGEQSVPQAHDVSLIISLFPPLSLLYPCLYHLHLNLQSLRALPIQRCVCPNLRITLAKLRCLGQPMSLALSSIRLNHNHDSDIEQKQGGSRPSPWASHPRYYLRQPACDLQFPSETPSSAQAWA